ncbi:MAG TPA: AAA family ATPase, partial [Cellvibrionaceae bacterium]
MDVPLMIVLAGPNGAGKTTFYFNELESNHPHLPFINADIIQHREMKDPDMAASYVAAKLAAERRELCLAQRQSFIWESTFSHPSKPELVHRARDAGYRVELIHISVETAAICIERVAQRLAEGGHNVPEHKIIERF